MGFFVVVVDDDDDDDRVFFSSMRNLNTEVFEMSFLNQYM